MYTHIAGNNVVSDLRHRSSHVFGAADQSQQASPADDGSRRGRVVHGAGAARLKPRLRHHGDQRHRIVVDRSGVSSSNRK